VASLINRIQRAMLGSAGPEKVRALLTELAIPAGGSGELVLRRARRGFLRPISDEAILRDALGDLGLTGGGGGGAQALSGVRNAILHNLRDSETTLRDGLNGLLEAGDLGEGGGGGETPAWVPDDAVIHIDLVRAFNAQDAAWVEGTGVVDVDTLLGSDVNTENYWDETSYDSGLLTANGYEPGEEETSVAFIGAARTALVAGATTVVALKQTADTSNAINPFILMAESGDNGVSCDLNFGTLGFAQLDGDDVDADIAGIVNNTHGAGAINVAAMTLTNARAELAMNGTSALEGTLGEEYWPVESPFVAAASYVGPANAIQSITLYAALPSTAGLSALSETGVTNTAPHDVVVTWADDRPSPTFTAAEMVTDFLAATLLSATDDEGNPLAWASSPHDNLAIGADGHSIVVTSDFSGASSSAITVRATDPGGLYVEQEFTITVTA
jgi:hypothetical protein